MGHRKEKTHISSHNQSGGITAGSVNLSGGGVSGKKRWRWIERWNWIAGIIAALIAGAAFLWSLKGGHIMRQSNPVNQQQGNTNISSFNQSGGITAHTVNLGPTPRVTGVEKRQHFQDSSRDAPKGNITVRFVADNDESHDFATQIHSLLSEAGYNVAAGVWPMMHFGTPVKGVQLEVRDKDNPPNFAKVLQALLEEIGIEALGAPGSTDQSQDGVVVYVGLRPAGDGTPAP